jgi:hypothetical protein
MSLAKCCKKLEIVNLSNCDNITDRGIKSLMTHCKGLLDLNLSACVRLTDLSILAIAEGNLMPGLSTLNLKGIENISETGISWLADKCPTLLSINVKHCTVSAEGLRAMRQSWRHVDFKVDAEFYGIAPVSFAKEKRLIDEYGHSCKAIIKIQSV